MVYEIRAGAKQVMTVPIIARDKKTEIQVFLLTLFLLLLLVRLR